MVVEHDTATPQFAHSVRGYDRLQVDEYVERVRSWGAQAEARAESQAARVKELEERVRTLESSRPATPDQAVQAAVDRAAAAVSVALVQAGELRRQSEQEAGRRMDEAEARASTLLEMARSSVAALCEEADRERGAARVRADEAVREAGHEAAAIRARAQADAERIMGDARLQADRVVSEAQAAAQAMSRRAEEESQAAVEGLQRLYAERDDIVAELGRLRGAIQDLITGAAAPPVAGAAPQAPSGSEAAATPQG